MKKALLLLSASVFLLSSCNKTIILVPDSNPYSFENPPYERPEMDDDVILDGNFEEQRWKDVRWLHGIDYVNENQYTDIRFTISYGQEGLYFGMIVQEYGNLIWVNPLRNSFMNSCMEMYMAPKDDPKGSTRMFEFDFVADGSYMSKLNFNGWTEVKLPHVYMPLCASKALGGEINHGATGYQIEAFFPKTYLEFGGYDVEHLDDLVMGVDPVHIYSFDYDSRDIGQARLWSQWSTKYIPVTWQDPKTFFHFDKKGLIAYDVNIVKGGSSKGIVSTDLGEDYVLPNGNLNLRFECINGSKISKLLINGEDKKSLLTRVESGVYTLEISNVKCDVNVEVDFD